MAVLGLFLVGSLVICGFSWAILGSRLRPCLVVLMSAPDVLRIARIARGARCGFRAIIILSQKYYASITGRGYFMGNLGDFCGKFGFWGVLGQIQVCWIFRAFQRRSVGGGFGRRCAAPYVLRLRVGIVSPPPRVVSSDVGGWRWHFAEAWGWVVGLSCVGNRVTLALNWRKRLWVARARAGA